MYPRASDPTLRQMEHLLMAYHYLYYVVCSPTISDRDYDALDREFLTLVPSGGGVESPIHHPGSELPRSYTPDEVELARELEG